MTTQYPNAGSWDRRGASVIAVVIHYTNGYKQGDLATLGHRESGVSAHYWIGKDGETVAIVPEDRAAWHAGRGGPMQIGKVSVTENQNDMNHHSIGIECEGNGDAWPLEQLSALTTLILGVVKRHPIRAIMGHQHWAGPDRKPDPGPRFPWGSLRAIVPAEVWVASTGCAGRVAQIPTTPTTIPVVRPDGSEG